MEEIDDVEIEDTAFVMRESEFETSEGSTKISYLACEPLEEAGFLNAFSTRLGGVSQLPKDALNLTQFKGDAKEQVEENRRRFLKAIGAEDATIVTVRQIHSTDRCFIKSMSQAKGAQQQCDAIMTKLKGVLLGVQTADCLPVLIADPKSGMMAAIHAGWRGTVGRITERTIADLMLAYGVNTRQCIAALGPVACVECYEIGEDVIEQYKQGFRYWRNLVVNFKEGGKANLDVRAANIQQLIYGGITEDRIYTAPYCTMHNNELFFSYRRESGGEPSKVGRLLSVIGRME